MADGSINYTVKEIVTEIQKDTAKIPAIEEHLRVLNGKILLHETRLQALEKSDKVNTLTLAKWGGAVAVLVFLVGIAAKVFV